LPCPLTANPGPARQNHLQCRRRHAFAADREPALHDYFERIGDQVYF